jgi:2-oxoisovalerate dehydrogenase E1 component alpha subunit
MQHRGWWNEDKDKELQTRARQNVLDALKKAETQPKPPIEDLFTDVYDELSPQLKEQQQELFEHLKKYPDDYPIAMHAKRNQ